jgi:hypothetical protein
VKRLIIVVAIISTACFQSALAEGLSAEKEQQLLEVIEGWGSGNPDVSLSHFFGYEPVKCATPEILTIQYYVENASLRVQQAYEQFINPRPESAAPWNYPSASGRFLVHFAKEGPHAPFGSDGTSVPDYVVSVARILDSVWGFEIDSLGYDTPPVDDFYAEGGDARYDVYLLDMITMGMGDAYGYSVPEKASGSSYTYTSYIAIENDFAEIDAYIDKPLDAVRVTAAHEFFHAIQFGYDRLEFEDPIEGPRHHWFEMSAVWMEEQAYDEVNDYYLYLPIYYENVHLSLRTAHLTMYPARFYPYGACLWPLYLSQTLGQGIVKRIWEMCAETGGPDVFQHAFEDAIVEASLGAQGFRSAISEFYVWNYFTGNRAIDGFGFEEAASYAMVPDLRYEDPIGLQPFIQDFNLFPVEYNSDETTFPFWPDYLGTNYLRFKPVRIDSTLRFILDGEDRRIKNHELDTIDFDWAIRVAKLSADEALPLELDPVIYRNHDTVAVRNASTFIDIILVLVPYTETRLEFIHKDVTYSFAVIDTTVPISGISFSDPYPNPLVLSEETSEEPRFKFRVVQPGRDNIRMDVFTIAGEKVLHSVSSNPDFVFWDGRNEAGALVASGLYLVSIRVGGESRIFKVAIIE